MDETILKVENLKVGFRNGKNILTAVEDISFEEFGEEDEISFDESTEEVSAEETVAATTEE